MNNKLLFFNLLYFSIDKRIKGKNVPILFDKIKLKDLKNYLSIPSSELFNIYFTKTSENLFKSNEIPSKLTIVANIIKNVSFIPMRKNIMLLKIQKWEDYTQEQSIEIIEELCDEILNIVKLNKGYDNLRINYLLIEKIKNA